jgi:prepilin-type N-terminal cleavage/methylation domain-containing protein
MVSQATPLLPKKIVLLGTDAMERHNSPTPKSKTSSAFTLVELLVVISIIAILAGLSFPAVSGAMDSAKKTQAKSNAVQIATAVTAYEMEYGKLPAFTGTTVDKTLVDILTTNNSRGIVFLEAPTWKKGKGGTNSSGDYCDPWSSTSAYAIALDTDYDNKVSVSTNGGPSGSYEIMKKVGVWNQNTTNKYQVRSWE